MTRQVLTVAIQVDCPLPEQAELGRRLETLVLRTEMRTGASLSLALHRAHELSVQTATEIGDVFYVLDRVDDALRAA